VVSLELGGVEGVPPAAGIESELLPELLFEGEDELAGQRESEGVFAHSFLSALGDRGFGLGELD
jgi:hypothetical protein